MTVKKSISLTDRHHAYAQQKMRDEEHGSLSSVVAAGLERLMQDEEERNLALEAMAEAIQERMKMPDAQWIEGVDDLFDKARKQLGDA